jgi:hypothetical protein
MYIWRHIHDTNSFTENFIEIALSIFVLLTNDKWKMHVFLPNFVTLLTYFCIFCDYKSVIIVV